MTERLAQILADSFFKILIPGITVTIPLTALSFSISLVISVAVALVQFAQVPVLTKLARLYIWIIRGTPILVQLFVVFYGLPGVGILIEPFPAAVLILHHCCRILPQALRTAFPTLANSLIAMVKDTSLAANITVTEMFMTTQRIVARTYEPLALYLEVGLVYLLFCTVLTRVQAWGEKLLNRRGAQRS